MCFEFEALYWAKLAEEAEKEKALRLQAQDKAAPGNPASPVHEASHEDAVPA
jgi:hypothetical protein